MTHNFANIFQEFDEISDNAKSFMTSTVVKRKEDRLTAEQCLSHPWLTRFLCFDLFIDYWITFYERSKV
jgi:hypothetical protein